MKSYKTALNFAVPEVRDLKFRVIEELFTKYDFDGLEIDWLRSAPYFLPGTEGKNARLLTEFLTRVRKHLNKRAMERGRPIPLAVRVNESLNACRLDGFDVPTWIENDLVDLIVLGSGVIDIEVEEFRKIAAPRGVPVYPCLYGWPSRYSPIPPELASGMTLTYWNQGADGIYLFNWFPHTKNNSEATGEYQMTLMKQLGDPKLLRAKQPRLMFAADRGRPAGEYPHNWMHCILPAELTDKPLKVSIRVGEDVSQSNESARITLRLSVENLQSDDQVEVVFNENRLTSFQREGALLTAALKRSQVTQGRNSAALRLVRRSKKSDTPRSATALDVVVVRAQD